LRLLPHLTLVAVALFSAPALACDYPGGPPDAREVRATGEGVTWAYYSNATRIYGHGILGDRIEAGALRAETALTGPCQSMVYLGAEAVFEDVTPRIADVTGDGLNDVVVIETRLDAGSSLAVYGMDGETFTKLAATPHIGRRFRWLAPAGIADFDGDGVLDVAYVETPHIGGTLRIWSFAGNNAHEIVSSYGFSNHRIGEDFITGGVRDCGHGPELVLPNFDWGQLMVVRYSGGALDARAIGGDTGAIAVADALARRN